MRLFKKYSLSMSLSLYYYLTVIFDTISQTDNKQFDASREGCEKINYSLKHTSNKTLSEVLVKC